MHGTLLFVGVMVAFLAIEFATLAVFVWVIFLSDPSAKRWSSSWLSAMFWPFLPLISWFGNRHSARLTFSQKSVANAASGGITSQCPKRFDTVREAEDYLVKRIADEAEREGTPLSEVERKMLYFTESGWTLPDMKEVSAEFDRSYVQEEYERKIAQLVRRIHDRDETQSELEREAWDSAVEKLSEGDHYILVLIDAEGPKEKPIRRWFKVLFATSVFLGVVALNIWFKQWMRDH
jgi:hypothetical protein